MNVCFSLEVELSQCKAFEHVDNLTYTQLGAKRAASICRRRTARFCRLLTYDSQIEEQREYCHIMYNHRSQTQINNIIKDPLRKWRDRNNLPLMAWTSSAKQRLPPAPRQRSRFSFSPLHLSSTSPPVHKNPCTHPKLPVQL